MKLAQTLQQQLKSPQQPDLAQSPNMLLESLIAMQKQQLIQQLNPGGLNVNALLQQLT